MHWLLAFDTPALVGAGVSAFLHAVSGLAAESVTPRDPTLIVDLFNFEWWQTLGVVLVGAGLSPAPWILGLATGKIQFTTVADKAHDKATTVQKEAYDGRLAEQARNHEALLGVEARRYDDLRESRDVNAAAAEKERQRADRATEAAFTLTEVVEANTHVIASINELAEEAAKK